MRNNTATAARRPGHEARRSDRVLPDQHGAWGFLLLPVVLGLVVGGWSPAVLALVVAWVAAYPLTWALTGTLAAPRPQRFRRALVVWSVVAVPAAVATVVLRPWLLYVGAAYVALFLVNLWFARHRRERALANDLLLVVECTAMVPVVAGVAAAGGGAVPVSVMTEPAVLVLALACALTLVGSTLHVKSLIRERRNPRYARVSRWFAVASVSAVATAVAVTEVGWPLVLPFVVLGGRAFVVRDPRMRPAKIGLVELACLILLAVCASLAV
ncbi:YwiC-like family protein [Nocardioides dilutus]